VVPPGKVDPFDLFNPLRTKPVVVAAQDARFGRIEVRRGIFTYHGATLRIVQRAGWGDAMRYLLTGEEFDAQTEIGMGLVQEVVPSREQLIRATALAEIIAAQAPLAVTETIRLSRKGLFHGWPTAISDLGPLQRDIMRTEDAAEGMRSFQEKRDSVFTGR